MLRCRSCNAPFGTTFLIGLLLLPFLPLIVSEETQQQSSGSSSNNGADDAKILFQNCDVETYYENDRDGEWGWQRVGIASLLLKTHRQIVPSDAVSEFLSGESFVDTSSLYRKYATTTDITKALTELDGGTDIVDGNNTIKTIHMTFSNTYVPVNEGTDKGWEPGHLWPMEDVKDSLFVEDGIEYQNEAIAAIHDLHNIRPRHPRVHSSHRTNNWYYNTCQECKLDIDDITVEQRMEDRASDTRPQWDGENFEGKEVRVDGGNSLDYDEGTDHLCVCTREHALQPPKMARGEVARALLYMNLRYGTATPDHDTQRIRNHTAYLDLALTDCHPLISSDDYDDDSTNQRAVNTMGYFSRLVEWHLEDPPSEREKNRNDAICKYHQGNRNPFVDFYEESWALLDFDRLEREVCAENSNGDDDDNYVAPAESDADNSEKQDETAPETESNGFGCGELMPGDISFYMVKPFMDIEGTINLSQSEEWKHKSFGLVTLVDLEPGLVIYVAGVDEGGDGEGGIMKLEVPEKGIPARSYFGNGNRMYLGDQWEPVLEAGEEISDFRFSVHQLYLYCVGAPDDITYYSAKEEYKILAALSTTGKSFGNEGLPSYWEKFQEENPDTKLSENFSDGISYGLIVLPEDASNSQVSGGYRYVGPTFTKHDSYAKALIDEAYWKRMNSLDDEGIYDVAEDGLDIDTNVVDISKVQPRLVGRVNSSSSGRALRSLFVSSMAFAACILQLF